MPVVADFTRSQRLTPSALCITKHVFQKEDHVSPDPLVPCVRSGHWLADPII